MCVKHSRANPQETLILTEIWQLLFANNISLFNLARSLATGQFKVNYKKIIFRKVNLLDTGYQNSWLLTMEQTLPVRVSKGLFKNSTLYIKTALSNCKWSSLESRTNLYVSNMLKKAKDTYKAPMDYINAQIDRFNMFPSQLFLGRKLLDILPCPSKVWHTIWKSSIIVKKMVTWSW